MEFLEQLDTQLFLFLNGLNSPLWDTIMYWISYRYTWIPLYIATLIYFVYKQKYKAIITIILAIGVIALADQISVNLFKNVFLRYRPCHNTDIKDLVHIVHGHCGGQYGFVSSHAANAFGFASFSALVLQKRNISVALIIWAIIVSYSRVYLGVHYPADIIGGAILGLSSGLFMYLIYQKISARM